MGKYTPNITTLLSSLSKSQRTFLKKRINNSVLFDLHIKYLDDQKNDDFFFQSLCKVKKLTRQTYNNKKTELKKQIEILVAFYTIEHNKNVQNELLLNSLTECTESSIFFDYAEAMLKNLLEKNNKGVEDYRFLAEICFRIHFHPDHSRFYQQSERKKIIDYFEKGVVFYEKHNLLNEARITTETLTRKALLKNIQSSYLETYEEVIRKTKNHIEPVFKLYAYLISIQKKCLKSIASPNDRLPCQELKEFWEDFKKTVFVSHKQKSAAKMKKQIADLDIQLLCSKLSQVISITHSLAGAGLDIEKYKEYLELYLNIQSFLDDLNLILHENRISVASFIPISISALFLGKKDWYHKFYHKYSEFVAKENREAAMKIVNAFRAFYEKDFTRAEQLIEGIDPQNNKHIKLYYRLLQLFILYERDKYGLLESELLSNRIRAMRQYLRDEKAINEEKNIALKETAILIKDLMDAYDKNGKKELSMEEWQTLENRIKNKKYLYSRYWLYLKLQEIQVKRVL